MPELIVRKLGLQPYIPIFESMQLFTEQRDSSSADELWFLEHEPVYTQGRSGKPDYLLNTGEIPVVQIDRGGQVTYHGPGQITVYTMLDIKRLGLNVRQLVTLIETAVVNTLSHWGINSEPRADAPGVYVDGAKIAALGLRIRKGCSYHGLNFNISMDMTPWSGINPCGLGVEVTQLSELMSKDDMPEMAQVESSLLQELMPLLGYNAIPSVTDEQWRAS